MESIMTTDRQKELEYYHRKGEEDFKHGENHSPDENLVEHIRVWNHTTLREATSSYNSGRSGAGRDKK